MYRSLANHKMALLAAITVGLSIATQSSLAQESESASQDSKTLKAQLEQMAEGSKRRLPAAMLETMESAINELKESNLVETARGKGDAAIDATLKTANGESVTLSQEWSEGPVVLMWYRGGWCPYCNLQLKAMNDRIKSLESTGAKLLVVSPELPEKSQETIDRNQLEMTILHDPHNELAQKYGIVFKLPDSLLPLYRDRLGLSQYNGDDSMQLPLAATYVIDQEGTIRYSYLEEDYKKRAEPTEVMAAVRSLVGPPQTGQIVDDFTLSNLQGESVALSGLLEKGPVVWVMLRGFPGYQCPICSRQVASLVSSAQQLRQQGASVVMVYPGPRSGDQWTLQDKAREFQEGTTLPEGFHFLIDEDYHVTDLYGLRWEAERETAYPTTLLLDSDGKVVYSKVSKTHGGRANVEDILDALKKISDK